jgi:hypothetical protein
VSRVVQARSGDVGCIVVALLIGGLATDAADVASGSYAPVNDLVEVAAHPHSQAARERLATLTDDARMGS